MIAHLLLALLGYVEGCTAGATDTVPYYEMQHTPTCCLDRDSCRYSVPLFRAVLCRPCTFANPVQSQVHAV
eukprot:IDg17806t1